jgi:hypothetical protein
MTVPAPAGSVGTDDTTLVRERAGLARPGAPLRCGPARPCQRPAVVACARVVRVFLAVDFDVVFLAVFDFVVFLAVFDFVVFLAVFDFVVVFFLAVVGAALFAAGAAALPLAGAALVHA